MFNINITGLDELTRSLNALPQEIENAKEHALDVVAARGLALKNEEIAKTYARPAKTPRTGAWRDGQKIAVAPGERVIYTEGAASEPITNYPGGYEEKLGKLNTENRNPASEIAGQRLEAEAQDLFERAFRERLEQGR